MTHPTSDDELTIAHLKDCIFIVKPSHHSAFEEFEKHTDLPCIHLVMVDHTEEMLWDELKTCGISNGQLIDVCDAHMEEIIHHYFGESYTKDDFAWRYAINSLDAVSLNTVHLHLYLAHKDLFGKDGLIQRAVGSILRRDVG